MRLRLFGDFPQRLDKPPDVLVRVGGGFAIFRHTCIVPVSVKTTLRGTGTKLHGGVWSSVDSVVVNSGSSDSSWQFPASSTRLPA